MSAVSKLVLMALVGLLVIYLLARDPQGMGHLVAAVFTIAVRLLDGVAAILNTLVGGQAAH